MCHTETRQPVNMVCILYKVAFFPSTKFFFIFLLQKRLENDFQLEETLEEGYFWLEEILEEEIFRGLKKHLKKEIFRGLNKHLKKEDFAT